MPVEHIDVLIVGAGLSGIGAGYHLQTHCPDKRYLILESRNRIGGTWDLFRYPGVRSDSDMFTLGYSFRPWTQKKAIADGASILEYVRDTAREFGIDQRIRFQQKVISASWSSETACWTVEAEVGPDRERRRYTCHFLYICSGYYSYENGYTPELSGMDAYQGTLVHPQQWPETLDYADKRIVVIGSGATAITLVPALAKKAAHVTMLQRSPTYIVSLPNKDSTASALRRRLPKKLAHRLIRWKNLMVSMAFYSLCRSRPALARKLIRKDLARQLPPDYPIDEHFNPRYKPWDQRLCLVPNGDLFRAIRKNRASVITDHIDTFTEQGIRTASGQELQADIIVTATGLKLLPCGDIEFDVDGKRLELGKLFSYKGVMLSGIPNMAICIGYTNASWTLRADLTSQYVCRLLKHMRRKGYRQCTPQLRETNLQPQPLLNLNSSYILRSAESFPKQGIKAPWRQSQNYLRDLVEMRLKRVNDKTLIFTR